MISLSTHQPLPTHFREHILRKEYLIDNKESDVWKWLNNPNTFIDTQIWPFKVEFTRTEEHKTDFDPGVFNSHHGPFMSFTGVIGEVKSNYRDLKYLYGSYFLSLRYIRPHRLEFWSKPGQDGSIITVQLSTYVSPGFYKLWNWSQNIFWANFGKKMSKGIKKLKKRETLKSH